MNEALDLAKRLRQHADKLRIKRDHYHAEKCLEDAELIEDAFQDE